MQTLDLGIDTEELREQVIERAAAKLVTSIRVDVDGARLRAEDAIGKAINAAVDKVVAESIAPLVPKGVEDLVLTKTNEWGEKKGESLTFREYAIKRAEAFLTEPVNHDGKTRDESRDGYSFRPSTTRVAHMVHKHLEYSIKSAIETALKSANERIVGGIEQAVKMKLNEVSAALKVNVKS